MNSLNEINNKIVFHHTLKTGGTSFSNWMTSVFGEKNVMHINEEDGEKLNLLKKSDFENLNGIHGHGSFHALKYLDNALNITIVRDPISFAISRYIYDRQYKIKKSLRNIQPIVGEVKISKFYEDLIKFCFGPVFNIYPNMYLNAAFLIKPELNKYFDSNLSINENLHKYSRKKKKLILNEIMNCFDIVWTTDNLDMLCFILIKKYNLNLEPIHFQNVSGSNQYYLTNQIKKKIYENSSHNNWIYEIATKKMDLYIKNFFNENPSYYTDFLKYKKSCKTSYSDIIILNMLSDSFCNKVIRKIKNFFWRRNP